MLCPNREFAHYHITDDYGVIVCVELTESTLPMAVHLQKVALPEIRYWAKRYAESLDSFGALVIP